jgi:hypothetical protein
VEPGACWVNGQYRVKSGSSGTARRKKRVKAVERRVAVTLRAFRCKRIRGRVIGGQAALARLLPAVDSPRPSSSRMHHHHTSHPDTLP